MVKKTKNFSDLALKIFKEHYDFLHKKELYKWICDQCENRYESREELEIHRLKHIQNVRNICNECGKEFESMEELFEHEYCYICEQCDNGYNSIEELDDHRRRKHTKFNWEEENSNKKRKSRVERVENKVIQRDKMPSKNKLAVSTNEMAAPEIMSKEVVQSIMPEEKK